MFIIREIIVSARQEEHILVKHGVRVEEVEEVLSSDPLVLRGKDKSYVLYGRSAAGRLLAVFLYPRGRGVFSLATARDMKSRERRRYRAHKGR